MLNDRLFRPSLGSCNRAEGDVAPRKASKSLQHCFPSPRLPAYYSFKLAEGSKVERFVANAATAARAMDALVNFTGFALWPETSIRKEKRIIVESK